MKRNFPQSIEAQKKSAEAYAFEFTLKPGQMFRNYKIISGVGHGGMGIVYKALDTVLDRKVALKLISSQGVHTHEARRFFQEAKAIAQLEHPNIVRLLEVGASPVNYFTMEYIEGKTLNVLINEGQIKMPEAVHYIQKAALALHDAHKKKIIHRDVKPSNIMINQDNELKIMDFGLAKMTSVDPNLSETGDIFGTPKYMSPEQATGKTVDKRTDIYSLGATFYETLTGQAPFTGEQTFNILYQVINDDPVPPRKLNPEIPKDLETICLKCIAKDPEARYKSCKMLARDLQNFLEQRSILAKPSSWTGTFLKFLARNALAIFLTLNILLAWSATAAGYFYFTDRRQKDLEQAQAKWDQAKAEISGELSKALVALNPLHRRYKELQQDRDWLDGLHSILGTVKDLRGIPLNETPIPVLELYGIIYGVSRKPEEYQKALEIYNWILKNDPRNYRIFINRGNLYFQRKLYEKAEQDYNQAIQIDPQNALAYSNRGILYHKLERHQEAQKDLDQAIQLTPEDADLYVTRGNFYTNQKLYQKAEQDYQKSLTLAPLKAEAYANFGLLRLYQLQFSEAIKHFNRAVQLGDNSAEVYNNRGMAHQSESHTEDAMKDYNQALQLKPKYAKALHNRGLLNHGLKRYEEAKQDYDKAIEFDPDHVLAYMDRGALFYEQGKYTQAELDYNKAVQLAPELPSPYINRGSLYFKFKQYQKAIADWEKAQKLGFSQKEELQQYIDKTKALLKQEQK